MPQLRRDRAGAWIVARRGGRVRHLGHAHPEHLAETLTACRAAMPGWHITTTTHAAPTEGDTMPPTNPDLPRPAPTWQQPPRRRQLATRWVLIVAAAVGAAAFAAGLFLAGVVPGAERGPVEPNRPDTVVDQPLPAAPLHMNPNEIGTYMEDSAEIGEITVTRLERAAGPETSWGEPPARDVFVIVTFSAVATGEVLWPISPLDFHVRDAGGRQWHYTDGNAMFAVENLFAHTELYPGETVTGSLAFDVPDVAGLELVYTASGRTLAFWAVP